VENNIKHPGWGKNWWESRQADTRKLTTRRAIKKSVPHTNTLTPSGRGKVGKRKMVKQRVG